MGGIGLDSNHFPRFISEISVSIGNVFIWIIRVKAIDSKSVAIRVLEHSSFSGITVELSGAWCFSGLPSSVPSPYSRRPLERGLLECDCDGARQACDTLHWTNELGTHTWGLERLGQSIVPMGHSQLSPEWTRGVTWPPSELQVWDSTREWKNPYR